MHTPMSPVAVTVQGTPASSPESGAAPASGIGLVPFAMNVESSAAVPRK